MLTSLSTGPGDLHTYITLVADLHAPSTAPSDLYTYITLVTDLHALSTAPGDLHTYITLVTDLVVVVVVVYWQKCGQRNRDTTRIAVKNKT